MSIIRKILIVLSLLVVSAFAQDYQYFPVSDFSGGLNLKDSPTKLRSNEAVTLNNAMCQRGKALSAKKGFRKFNSTVIDTFALNSIYKWLKSEETERWIVGCGPNLYIIDGDSTNFIGNELTYTTGTVKVDTISSIVYGIGTKWKRVFGEGSGLSITIGDTTYTIDKIISNELLTITTSKEDPVSNQSYTIYHKFSTGQKFFNTWLGKCIITDSYSPALSYDTSGVLPLAIRFYGDADSIYYDNDTLIVYDSSQVWADDDLIGERFILAEFVCTTSAVIEDSIVLLPISDQTKQWTREPTDSTCSYCLVDELKGSEDDANYVWVTGTTNKKEKWGLDTLDTPFEANSRFYRGDSLRVWVRNKVRAEGVDEPDSGTMGIELCRYATHSGYTNIIVVDDSTDFGVKTVTFTPDNTGGGKWDKSGVNNFYLQIRNVDASDTHWVSQVYPVLYFKKRTTTHTHYPVLLTVVDNTSDKIYLTPSKLRYTDNHPQEYLVFNSTLLQRAFVDSGTTENMDSNTTLKYLYAYDTDKTWDSTDFQSGYYEIYFPRLGSYHSIIGNAFNVSGDDTGIVILNLPQPWVSSEVYRIYRWEYLRPTTQEIFDHRLWLAGDSLDPNYIVASEKDAIAESERDFNTEFYTWIDRDDGDKIIRFYNFFKDMYIFKQRKIKKMTKWIDYEITDISKIHGTPSPHSVVEHPEGVFFYNKVGVYVIIDDKLTEASDKIEPFVDDSVDMDYLSKVCAAYYDDHVFFSLPTGSVNDTTFLLYPPFARWGTLSGVIASSFFVNHDPSDSNEFLFGDTDSGWVYVYGQSYQDLGVNYDITYKSGWFDMGTSLRKRVKDIKLNYEKADSTLIIFKFYTDYYDTLVYADTVGIDTLDVFHQVRLPLTPELIGYSFQVKLTITRVDAEFVLPFFELNWNILSDQEYDE